MSDAIFPTLAGLTFPVHKTPNFSTVIKTSVGGREIRRANMAAPVWNIGLVFEVLRDEFAFDELKTLLGFFTARRGSFDSFLFFDEDDNSVVNEQIGIGDGVTRSFQLARTYGGFTEPVCNPIADSVTVSPPASRADSAVMWASDTSELMWAAVDTTAMWSSDYVISSTGLVTFNTAPDAGVQIVWSGSFYYRCRFVSDQMDFQKFMQRLWDARKCELRGSLGVKI